MTIPFGKYKGEDVLDCPVWYLRWLLEQDWVSDDLKEEADVALAQKEGIGVVRKKWNV